MGMITVTDKNRAEICKTYIEKILEDNKIDPVANLFIYQRICWQKNSLSNSVLQQEISQIHPEILEDSNDYGN